MGWVPSSTKTEHGSAIPQVFVDPLGPTARLDPQALTDKQALRVPKGQPVQQDPPALKDPSAQRDQQAATLIRRPSCRWSFRISRTTRQAYLSFEMMPMTQRQVT